MSKDTIFTGSISSKNQFGASVVLADGRKGFLPATEFGGVDRKKGDSVNVVITGEGKGGKLQLAIAGAESQAPVFIFIDEIEALLGDRGERSIEERDPTVDAFLAEIDKTSESQQAPFGKDKLIMVAMPGFTDPAAGWLGPNAVGVGQEAWLAERALERRFTTFEVDLPAAHHAAKEDKHGKKNNKKRNKNHNKNRNKSRAQKSDGHVQKSDGHAHKSGGHPQNGVWSELRALAEANRNFQLNLKRAEGQHGLFGHFKGVKCFLPKTELASEFKVDSVSPEGSLQWVKIVSVSRAKRSVIVSMRLHLTRDELLAAGAELKAKVAEQKERKESRKSAEAQAWKDFESLVEGQEVHGTVVNVLSRPGTGGGKPYAVYFVKIATQLVGALGEHQVPFEPGTRQPRVLKVGEQVSVRITRKFTKIDKKTKAELPKVDLSMRRPADPNRSGGRQKQQQRVSPQARRLVSGSFPSACGKTNETLAAASEKRGRGTEQVARHPKPSRADRRRGRGNGPLSSGTDTSQTSGIGSVGEALMSALARRSHHE
jgi:ATPase family associated with various cellular activities (AAA)